ncbi:hypothetical protein D3C76_1476080 [compost metagenome]
MVSAIALVNNSDEPNFQSAEGVANALAAESGFAVNLMASSLEWMRCTKEATASEKLNATKSGG